MTHAQQFIYGMAMAAGYEHTRRAWEAIRPVGPFHIGHTGLTVRAALQFAMYEMEGRR